MMYRIRPKYIAYMLCKLYYQLIMSNLIQLYFNLIDFFFLEREFQLMAFTPNESFLSTDQDIN